MAQKQPGSKFCFICGRENPVGLKMDFYMPELGRVRAEVSVPRHFEGYPGVVHGGIVASILDEGGGRSQMMDQDHFMVTAQLNVRYRKPVPSETPLLVIGTAGERQGRVAHAHGEIQTQDGEVLAEAELVLVDMPEALRRDMDPEALGWRVYPDEKERENDD